MEWYALPLKDVGGVTVRKCEGTSTRADHIILDTDSRAAQQSGAEARKGVIAWAWGFPERNPIGHSTLCDDASKKLVVNNHSSYTEISIAFPQTTTTADNDAITKISGGAHWLCSYYTPEYGA
ncbi:hypothetical protein SCARD494_09311 [Seiridium cardinale]